VDILKHEISQNGSEINNLKTLKEAVNILKRVLIKEPEIIR